MAGDEAKEASGEQYQKQQTSQEDDDSVIMNSKK